MAPQPRQHALVIEAINAFGKQPFSGWEVSRRTGLSRTTVSRVMGVLKQMGLLAFGPGGSHTPWRVTMSWVEDTDLICEQYACWIAGRRRAKRILDRGGAAMVW